MPKFLTIFLLTAAMLALAPAARAECGFSHDSDTLTIVVGKGSQSCFSSDEFRTAFKAQVTAALEGGGTASGTTRQKRAFDDRNGSGRKL
ncbi:hypothetical protein [Noviherbaspirillum malthae]|uniref:hypothetical protein n=1 Tax=Noviherbaspirillum malthae TaxID=1260987 RepID=UPI00188E3290|nr:hypothetical protein [Noviherbaspirillum malthae]